MLNKFKETFAVREMRTSLFLIQFNFFLFCWGRISGIVRSQPTFTQLRIDYVPVTQPPLDLVSREALDHNRLFHYYYLFGKLPQVRKCESGNETSIACLWFTCAACNTDHNSMILCANGVQRNDAVTVSHA